MVPVKMFASKVPAQSVNAVDPKVHVPYDELYSDTVTSRSRSQSAGGGVGWGALGFNLLTNFFAGRNKN